MPIGIAIGGAAATVGGAALGASAQKKSASKAAAASTANNTANNALARENRTFAQGVLSPYSQAGIQAQGVLGGLLYGSPSGSGSTQKVMVQNPDGSYTATTNANALATPAPMDREQWANGALQAMNLGSRGDSYGTLQQHLSGSLEGPLDGTRMAQYDAYMANNPQPNALGGGGGGNVNAQSAWDQFRNSSNYQFRFDEGMKGLNLGLANNGLQGSGAAVKEAIKYGQNFGSNELNNYIGLLQGQQQIGMGAASAMVGVGQNTTNALMANNSSNAQNQANASLVQGQANANMWGGIASGIGQAAGSIGSSYRPASSQTFTGGGSFATPMFGS